MTTRRAAPEHAARMEKEERTVAAQRGGGRLWLHWTVDQQSKMLCAICHLGRGLALRGARVQREPCHLLGLLPPLRGEITACDDM